MYAPGHMCKPHQNFVEQYQVKRLDNVDCGESSYWGVLWAHQLLDIYQCDEEKNLFITDCLLITFSTFTIIKVKNSP